MSHVSCVCSERECGRPLAGYRNEFAGTRKASFLTTRVQSRLRSSRSVTIRVPLMPANTRTPSSRRSASSVHKNSALPASAVPRIGSSAGSRSKSGLGDVPWAETRAFQQPWIGENPFELCEDIRRGNQNVRPGCGAEQSAPGTTRGPLVSSRQNIRIKNDLHLRS